MKLEGKNILVTAGGQGASRAAAIGMAGQGAHVWVTDRHAGMLVGYEGIPCVRTVVVDVLHRGAVERLIHDMPALDVLFNCGAYGPGGDTSAAMDEAWHMALNLNVRAPFWTLQAALPRMLSRGGGSIINLVPVCGSARGMPNRFIHGMTQAAIIGLTRSVAGHYVGDGIRCNAICAGTLEAASLALYLASDESAYITGQVYPLEAVIEP